MVVIIWTCLLLQNTALLLRELETCIPNSEIRDRMHVELKKIIPEAVGRDFTDIIVIHEDRKEPSILLQPMPGDGSCVGVFGGLGGGGGYVGLCGGRGM